MTFSWTKKLSRSLASKSVDVELPLAVRFHVPDRLATGIYSIRRVSYLGSSRMELVQFGESSSDRVPCGFANMTLLYFAPRL